MFTALIIGMISGYYGGKVDNIIMRIVDIFLAIPSILLSIAIAATLGGGIVSMLIAISLGACTGVSRLIRAQVWQRATRNILRQQRLQEPVILGLCLSIFFQTYYQYLLLLLQWVLQGVS